MPYSSQVGYTLYLPPTITVKEIRHGQFGRSVIDPVDQVAREHVAGRNGADCGAVHFPVGCKSVSIGIGDNNESRESILFVEFDLVSSGTPNLLTMVG